MRLSDLKYLTAYIGPISAYISIYFLGLWSFTGFLVAFALIPTLELFWPNHASKNADAEISRKKDLRFFDWLLYANIPILYGLIILFCWQVMTHPLSWWELVGIVLTLGIYIGASGINVAHELGHRVGKLEKYMSLVLLLPGLYMHFYIEHNHGHHRYVATPEDPATARFGESLYHFWWRSTVESWKSAWLIEVRRLEKEDQKIWSVYNRMIWFSLIQFSYLAITALIFGVLVSAFLAVAGIVGFLLLETINYIEHYGLMRRRKENGRYERVGIQHSWNSNHEIGRIFLYELSRHADHHYTARKKYQELKHHEESPQLPTGYPGSMMLALVPPAWFKIMNPRIPKNMIGRHS